MTVYLQVLNVEEKLNICSC